MPLIVSLRETMLVLRTRSRASPLHGNPKGYNQARSACMHAPFGLLKSLQDFKSIGLLKSSILKSSMLLKPSVLTSLAAHSL